MFCPKCGNKVPDDMNFCTECGYSFKGKQKPQTVPTNPPPKTQKKKGGCLKVGLIVVGVFIVLGIIGAAIGGEDASQPTTTSSTKSSDSVKSSSSKAASSKPEEKIYGVGETATSNDISIAFVGIEESTGSNMFTAPEEGKVYLLCEFNIENDSQKDINISSIISFEAYVDDYSINQSLIGLTEKGSKGQLDGSIAAGKKMNGIIAYEVPQDWKEIEIRVNPDVFSFFGREVTFKATK